MRFACFLFFLCPLLLTAQPDSVRLDTLRTVTIAATRLPSTANNSVLAVSVLERARIRQGQPLLSLQEGLAAVPGFFLLNDANYAQDLRISIRGFGARSGFGIRGIKLLLDDIPESAPDGQAQVDNLDLAAVDRIEVVRGASAGLYGNASGGVISIRSDAIPKRWAAGVRLTGGSYGFRQLHADCGTTWGKQGFRLALTHLGHSGYREHAVMRSTLLNGKWRYMPDTSASLSILVNYVNSPLAEDAGALSATQVTADRRAANPNNIRYNAGEAVAQGRVGLVYEKHWNAQELRLRGYSTWRAFDNRLPFQNGGQVTLQRWFAGGGAQYTRVRNQLRLTAGLDLDRQTDLRRRYDNEEGRRGNLGLEQQETFGSAGLFTSAEWNAGGRWTLSGGGRLDLVQLRVVDRFETDGLQSGQSTFERASPWGGLVYRLSRRLLVYANTTTNFETPTLIELSNNPANSGGFNTGLKPQRTLSLEAGLRGRWPAGMLLEVACFYTRTQDALVPYELIDFPGRTFYQNAGETLQRGIELAIHGRLLRGLTADLAYTLADFKYHRYETPAGDLSGRALPGLPGHWGMMEVQYQHREGWFGRLQIRQAGRYFADDTNSVPVEAYVLLHLRGGYTKSFGIGHIRLFAGADNLTNTAYFNNIRINAAGARYFEPGAGLTVFGGVEWNLD
ncbi:MAG: TonB-dependent receptor [Bacteroidetes bacterium]|nr:MAG: TonB-dependent receptor [Bacteroidota bacterium]